MTPNPLVEDEGTVMTNRCTNCGATGDIEELPCSYPTEDIAVDTVAPFCVDTAACAQRVMELVEQQWAEPGAPHNKKDENK